MLDTGISGCPYGRIHSAGTGFLKRGGNSQRRFHSEPDCERTGDITSTMTELSGR